MITGALRCSGASTEVLVDRVEAVEELAEPSRADRQHQRQADRRVDRVAAADPVPEAEHVVGVDAELGDLLGVGADRDEVLADRRIAQRTRSASPACLVALVSVSIVVNVFELTMNSVVAGSRSARLPVMSAPSTLLT